MRYFLQIAFKGASYNGWQIQKNGLGVQQVMNERMSKLLGEPIYCVGCGRTDTGVHASDFYLHFDSVKELDEKFARKLNSFLPNDITVKALYHAPIDTNARWKANERTYTYRISTVKDPFKLGLAMQMHYKPDVELMNQGASILLEYEDFKAFSKSHAQNKHHRCSIRHASWHESGDELIFIITANRFLRGMVRIIVGTLLLVGRNKMTLQQFRAVIESMDRKKAGGAVPPEGLYLSEVKYPEGLLQQIYPN